MALNPIVFTEKVVRSFLRYQLTAYPFADERLYAQMRTLLSLDETRRSPLLKGPFITLSKPFRQGAAVDDLIREGVFHPLMRQRIPAEITHLRGHQEQAIRSIRDGKTTLISTGTGSGKTECFLYPIISKCLELRDEGAKPGISAVLVYPMNALAEDQLGRLRSLLAGTGIPFGMYVGKTPERENEVTGFRMPAGSSRADYEAKLEQFRREKRGDAVYPPEEVCSREVMRTAGRQPRILLTNVKQLELLLTRQKDVELFTDARLDFLVFDEAHTFTGASGAEAACLIRRLRTFCGNSRPPVCVATSATIADPNQPDAAREFASRFFGVAKESVTTVGESYERSVWAEPRVASPVPVRPGESLLSDAAAAVEDPPGVPARVRQVLRDLSGIELPAGEWPEALYSALSRCEMAFQLSEALDQPRSLADLPAMIAERLGRPISEAEILAWLTLAAAARGEGGPLLRPVVHGFIRGISGAVVTFDDTGSDPRLWLAAEDEIDTGGGTGKRAHFPLLTCTACGQHYLVTYLKDFTFTGRKPGGGEVAGAVSFWEPLEEALGGSRVILVDRIVGGADDEEMDDDGRVASVFVCRRCGGAHPEDVGRCLHCGVPVAPVPLYAVRQRADNPGRLTSCLSCGAAGRQPGTTYREPARPVRATNVADVHVLAQDMVHHAERPRLLVFCDNRQDAAFQAGWMKDHARRFRLRALMAEGMSQGPVSIGDLVLHLDDLMERDEAMSRALVPEVWQVVRREGSGGRHEKERRKFLRIQVLREVTLSSRQAIGLEPWGRMKIEYQGLGASLPWIQQHARELGMPPEDLRDGVASLLDYLRRKRVLHDADYQVFTKYWMDGDQELQQGYLPQLGAPAGTKLRREGTEKAELVTQWLSDRGDTTIRQMARKWGVPVEKAPEFLGGLFGMLKEQGLLKPVTLKGSKGNPLPNVSGVFQVDADRLRLQQNHGVWRCKSCRRRTIRRTPRHACPSWRCDGTLEFVREDPDNYDLQVLDQRYTMLRPEEHTAMVPHEERERLENLFKGSSDAVNAFVCTPTLELGVDIGHLDAVLMRNVPPLPANYWQRAGRAGRRHRMAVDLTYCRPMSHDRAYFADPIKLLTGRVDPPSFNLRNELMVAKHVRAAVITALHQAVRDGSRSEDLRRRTDQALRTCLPDRVSHYLFDDEGNIRTQAFDLAPLGQVIDELSDPLAQYVGAVFSAGWPEPDIDVVSADALRRHVSSFVPDLEAVIARLARRLKWALGEIKRLNQIREQRGDLDQEDESLFRRCDALVKRLKGTARRARREAEGYDDVNTFGMLAAEGFLPGYGLETGSVLATAEIPFWRLGALNFSLPRPASMALREYVPGNLIYANGNRFVARRFHRDVDEQRIEAPVFEVSVERQAVKETKAAATAGRGGAVILPTIAVCDVDLIHQSQISDEEELRFQMGVAVYGVERAQHNGGQAYGWGQQAVHHRRGVRLRLVNVGGTGAIGKLDRFGYPVCTVCGQSVSPLASDRQIEHFEQSHLERCGRKPVGVGFYADVVADVLSLPGCPDHKTAYSVLEAIRFGATRVLDMHVDDLQVLVVGHVDRDEVDALLWDPMPGGSGLLDLLCQRFSEIVPVALDIVRKCPSACESSCVDCLQTFRNAFCHKSLSRVVAAERMQAWGVVLAPTHTIPALHPTPEPGGKHQPANSAEQWLRHLLNAAGFPEGVWDQQIHLDRAIGSTTPDVTFVPEDAGEDEAVYVYLDGLSGHLHGNPATAEKDRVIRAWLRNHGHEVIEIAASDLSDAGAMRRHFRRLAGCLGAGAVRETVSKDSSWFERATEAVESPPPFALRLVRPTPDERFVTCVPLVPLQAAAGGFGRPQFLAEGNWDWVQLDTGHRLKPGMFVAQVVGKSMEPRIPDGSYCLFASPVGGSRQGRTVLVQLSDRADPETGQRYTVKRYESEKATSEDGTWRHVKITLRPNNPDFESIVLTSDDEENLKVVAELVQVLG
jgi:hypothetical protein